MTIRLKRKVGAKPKTRKKKTFFRIVLVTAAATIALRKEEQPALPNAVPDLRVEHHASKLP